jgi:hypothetical protein
MDNLKIKYRNNSAINHFYDILLLQKEWMNTISARRIVEE